MSTSGAQAAPSTTEHELFIDPHGTSPLRAETYGLDSLESYGRKLGAASATEPETTARQPLLARFRDNSRFLKEACRTIGKGRRQEPLSPDAEWLLDNYFVIDEVVREVIQDLPAGYFNELPVLAAGLAAGCPRVFAMALGLIAHSDSGLDENEIRLFVRAFQASSALTIGELWAVPTMLRLGLIENLRRLAAELVQSRVDQDRAYAWVEQLLQRRVRGSDPIAPPVPLTDSCVVALLQALRDQETAGPAVEWLEDYLAQQNLKPEEVLRREHQRKAASQVSIGNAVTTLRLLGALNWSRFFEENSLVEKLLRQDPAGAYAHQDFATRDRYRQALEQLAKRSGQPEEEVAHLVLRRAEHASDARSRHVGYYLVDQGRTAVEHELGYRPRWLERPRRAILRFPTLFYFASLGGLTLALAWGVAGLADASWAATFVLFLFLLLPMSELALGIVHSMLMRLLPPRVLPKLDFGNGIPEEYTTFVVMPVMPARPENMQLLLDRLELHYLANPDPQLRFALLSDFSDADQESLPSDEELLHAGMSRIQELNARHAAEGPEKFFLFQRRRLLNPGEGRWMGWERKRGKLQEFNRLLHGDSQTSYFFLSTQLAQLPRVQFVLTLDADTNLPRDTARRLVATLAHPLNRAQFDPTARRVVAGYGLLQPRVSFLFNTGLRSRFARIFAGSAGIDPYSAAVSDVYQDLFAEGSYTGKGLYDLVAFEAATQPAFPDNSILSHDLIESGFARCGLATDIELLDDFPPRYHAYARREHRWVRGDWQLLPWLGRSVPVKHAPGRGRNPLTLLPRWKILDNLRRSLVPPALLTLFVLGWTVLPGPVLGWTLLGLVILSLPLWLQLTNIACDLIRGARPRSVYQSQRDGLSATLGQVVLATVFLVDQARLLLHAIGVTLYRLYVTRRHLLEWETAAATENRLGTQLQVFVASMWPASALALGLGALVAAYRQAVLPIALPLLLLWLLAPLVAWWVSQPSRSRRISLSPSDRRELRRLARKTWGFFETFIGPDDNWLPPDNYQEVPDGRVAHRTSPTNQGLLLLSTLAANDLGYLSLSGMADRLEQTFATLEKLERYRGHFLNWYETRTLQPLQPGYVSAVDSGNLLGCLIALRQALDEKMRSPLPAPAAFTGLVDTLAVIDDELLSERLQEKSSPSANKAAAHLSRLATDLAAEAPEGLVEWQRQLARVEDELTLLRGSAPQVTAQSDRLASWQARLLTQVREARQELVQLAPWVEALAKCDGKSGNDDSCGTSQTSWQELHSLLDQPIRLIDWPTRRDELLRRLEIHMKAQNGAHEGLLHQLAAAVQASTAETLCQRLQSLAGRAMDLADAMDFHFLYNSDRNLYSIGFNLAAGRLDSAHYDLLASEASLASFLTVSRGEVPRKHWFQLGRPATRVAGRSGLLSWGGTMFEYLMPRLLLPPSPGTLLDVMQGAAVARQQEYGRECGVPWGVSESAFNVRDAAQDYQYQSFGVPGLGIKRGLGQDLVVAPYASALALAIDPVAVCRNFQTLRALGAEGPHGFYEAIDFTPSRLEPNEKQAIIRSYMAHHQGMILVALTNCVLDDIMPRRLHTEPMVRATEILLQERVPTDAPFVHADPGDVVANQETVVSDAPVSRRITTPHTPNPRVHLLSAGDYAVIVTAAGGGFSSWRGLDVTRWREDRTLDATGQFCYVRDLQSGHFWSTGFQPARAAPDHYEVVFSADKAEFRRIDRGIETHWEIAVSPEKNVEMRRLTLVNHEAWSRDVDVTSYAELALAPHAADLAHPAFNKLFLETEWLPQSTALLCRRRPRTKDQAPVWALHVLASDASGRRTTQFETDRAKFVGRRRTLAQPAALDSGATLSGSVGAVLDPIFSLRRRVRLQPGASVGLAFCTALAESRQEALALADEFHSLHAVARAFELAWAHARVELRHLNLGAEEVHLFQRLAGHVLFAGSTLRAEEAVLTANVLGQPALWSVGLSGDLPIVLVRVGDARDLSLARTLLVAHTYWRSKGLTVDLVFLNENPASYFEELHQQLQALIRASDAHALVDKPGGVFVRKSSHLRPEVRTLLLAAARVVLVGGQTPLADQVDLLERRPALPPPLVPQRRPAPPTTDSPVAPPRGLQFNNGTGGFSADGREYVFLPGSVPPAPWSNVVANPQFGFLITESGAGYTWAGNSQQNRLTPWSNDPVADPPGEVLYLRDEETGEFWAPTPAPCQNASPAVVRYGAGYAIFQQRRGDLAQELRLFVAPDEPVKLLTLTLHNEGPRNRKLSATYFVEWVLGVTRDQSAQHVVTEIDPNNGTVFARNAFHADFGSMIAFTDVSHRPASVTGDRTEFLGRNGAHAAPAALRRLNLSGRVGAGLDPCAAVQVKFELPAKGETTIVFVLGQAADHETARQLATRYRDPGVAESTFKAVAARWDELLSVVQVRTPDAGFDLLVNRWLLTQVLACRLWGRSAFYQSGGAYGFRDQLQDVAALVYAAPAEARAHLLRAAGRQFAEGDVQHWWHPPSGQGVRTRITDDFLWLPFVVHHYVVTTGDSTVLDEQVPFLEAPPLAPNEEEVYGLPRAGNQAGSLFEHCARALENGWKLGPHGLPLMGTGDWNDGMNRVGAHGRGESVWLGWFQVTCLRQFAELAGHRQEPARQLLYLQRARELHEALEAHAWDGNWYLRAFFDDGTPLGSAASEECRIDSLAQTWAVLSGADPARARQAMASVSEQLIRRDAKLALLFTPPFDVSALEPGYIKGYVPGIRENGGQYTHAATWVVQALAALGQSEQAQEVFDILNPIRHAADPEGVRRYRVEPYVIAADVYSTEPNTGRGGWTWYTGSAAWLYRAALESILGFRKRGTRLEFSPHVPDAWKVFEVDYRHGSTVYKVTVRNAPLPGSFNLWVDGALKADAVVELVDDAGVHEVLLEKVPARSPHPQECG